MTLHVSKLDIQTFKINKCKYLPSTSKNDECILYFMIFKKDLLQLPFEVKFICKSSSQSAITYRIRSFYLQDNVDCVSICLNMHSN